MAIGILAFGSLINDPGQEIETLKSDCMPCTTPFKVEFARISSSRGGAPTLVPVDEGGSEVSAKIIVLNEKVTLEEAQTLLWRRETRQPVSSTGRYRKPIDSDARPNKLKIGRIDGFCGLDTVIYTDFPKLGKLPAPAAEILAKAAIESAKITGAKEGLDGISYLISAKKEGIVTPLLPDYEKAILKITGSTSLEDALSKTRKVKAEKQ